MVNQYILLLLKFGVIIKRLLAEFLGTLLLVATVVGSGIMATNLSADIGVQLIINSLATIFILIILITIFMEISGAHFNPVVTLVEVVKKQIKLSLAIQYITMQFLGGIFGSIFANLMFEQAAISTASKVRSGSHLLFSEVIATAGLILIINLLLYQGQKKLIPSLVGLWIGAGYFFTSSTSFANPAVTFARSLTDSFAGININSVIPFILAQFLGAAIGFLLIKLLISKKEENDAK